MKILIIQKKMIGDVLTSTILFEYLKKKHTSCKIHYLVDKNTIPILDNNPFIDRVLVYPKISGLGAFYSFVKKIRKEKYTHIIDVYSTFGTGIISYLSGSNYRIGYYKKYSSFLYKETYARYKKSNKQIGLAIENRIGLLSSFKVEYSPSIFPKIYLTNKEKKEAINLLTEHDININTQSIYMISVLGSGSSKTYPANYMAQVLDNVVTCLDDANTVLLFNYIPSQINEVKKIYKACAPKTQERIKLDVYGSSLRMFFALTSFCKGVIGNEGGAINMAKALDVPTFAIFSPWIKKESWSLYEDDVKNVSVHLKDYLPNKFKKLKKGEAKKNVSQLYNAFDPSFFKQKLIQFINS